MENLDKLVTELRKLPNETQWLEFKHNNYDPDMIGQDIRSTVRTDYIGKYANTYANKMLLVAVIRGYMQELEAASLIQPGWELDIDVAAQKRWLDAKGTDTTNMTRQQIREADTGSHVFLAGYCKPLDAIEDVDLAISI